METITSNVDEREEYEVFINDVTLREWDQAPLTSFNKQEKQIIALMLRELWIKNIEVWFWASRADADNIRWVAEVFSWDKNSPFIASLWRAVAWDTDASINVMRWYENARIHTFIATPDDHINEKFSKFWDDINERKKWVLNQIKWEVSKAKKFKDEHNLNAEIEFSPEAASNNAIDDFKVLKFWTTQFEFLIQCIIEAIESWANVINIPDTVWNLLPHETEELFREITNRTEYLKEEWFNFYFSCHIHNDLGLAWANAISAIRWWAKSIELTVAWIWERAWNTSLSEIVWIISEKWESILSWTINDWKKVVTPNIQTELVWPISRFVEKILNLDKSVQIPFIWALSDIDWSWVHNANAWVYWWTKNKIKYGWDNMEEFFSPRWWSNQIVNMLVRYWINEDKGSDIIQAVTNHACNLSEASRLLFPSNIYSLYLSKKWEFILNDEDIIIDWNKIKITFELFWEKYEISWEWEWKNWVIDGLITWINEFIWKNNINIQDIWIRNRPCLIQTVKHFYTEISKSSVELSEDFKKKVSEIIKREKWEGSKQIWIADVKLKVWENEFNSVSIWHNIDKEIVKAIIYWSLSEVINRVCKN